MKTGITTLFPTKAAGHSYLQNVRTQLLYLVLLIAGVLTSTISSGQANSYSFAASAGTYTPITGGTLLNNDPFNLDEWISNPITLTPGFTFNGNLYTTAYVSSNGFITLGNPAPDIFEYNPIDVSTGSGIAICPFSVDLDVSGVAAANSEIRFQTVGNEHIFQWTDASRYDETTERISFQARLNTVTGVITMVYGGTIAVAANTDFPIVGICTSTTDYKNIKIGTAAAQTWAAPLAGTATTSTMRFTSGGNPKSPTAGQTYTFTPPPCATPGSIAIGSITTTSASVSFNALAGANYIVEYGASGFTPGTGAAAGTGGTIITTTTSPVSISLLTPGTTYDVYIRRNCTSSGNGFSSNSARSRFNTLCLPTNVPYTQNFQSVTVPAIPLCTSIENPGTGNNWVTSNPGAYDFNTKCLTYTYDLTNAANAWFYTQGLTLTGGTSYRLKYRYGNNGGTTYPEKMAVKYGPAATATSMTFPLDDHLNIVNNVTSIVNTIDFTPATTGTYYIGFQCHSDANENALYLDDISVNVTPVCFPPTIITVGTITATTAQVSFTGTSPDYILEYGAPGFTPGTGATPGTGGTIITGTTSPITITGLTANTSYDFYIRGNCTSAAHGYSENSDKMIFTTNSCIPQTITTTTPGSLCGTGAVTLGATASGGTLNWYAANTGGSSIGTGSPFTTPSISNTTTYYVGAETIASGTVVVGAGGNTGTAVSYNPSEGTYGGMKGQYLFTAAELQAAGLQAGNITSIGLDFTAVGSTLKGFNVLIGTTTLTTFPATISIVGGLATSYTNANYAPVVGINMITLSTPFTWDGISNLIICTSWSNNNTGNTSSTIRYDNTPNYASQSYRRDSYTAANMLAFTGSTGAGTYTFDRTQNRPKMLFNGQTLCFAGRTPVIATINPKPDTSVTAGGVLTFCPNRSVTFTAATGLTYQWLLNNNVIAGATNATYTTSTPGSYRVKVSNATCTDTSNARVVTILPGPIATVTASGPTTFCAGDSVKLRGPLFTNGMSYQWQLNGVNIAGATDTMYTALTSGDYRLYMTNGTCSDTSAAITVTAKPLPTITVNPPTAAVCAGTSITLTASGADTYSWTPGASLSATTGASVVATPLNTTTYTINGLALNGCAASVTKTVTVSPAPTVTITPSTATAICIGDSVLLTASGAVTYSWSPSAGLTVTTGASVWAHPTTTTTYTVVGDDGIGCTATATKTVTVNPLPTINVTPATATTVCAGVSTTLTASGGVSYSWSPATGLNTTTGATVIATPATTTTYTVTGTNANGCKNTFDKLITVNPLPTLGIIPATAAICAGSSIPLQASGASTYTWTPTTAMTPSTGIGANVTVAPTTTTTYTVTGIGANGCQASLSRIVTVTAIPVVNITPAAPTAICAGSSVNLTATGATSYSWSPNTGLSSTTTATVTASPTATITYTVTGTTNGCSAIATRLVTVNPLPTAAITAGSATAFCQGGSVVLTANTGTGLGYTWRTNGVANGGTSSTFTATASGNYDVIVSNGTCTNTSNVILVNVSTPPVTTVTPLSSTTFCQGGSVVLSATVNAGYTYQWALNGTNITVGGNSASYTATTAGSYTVTIVNGTCTGTSTPVAVTVNATPPAQILPLGATTFCDGGAVTLYASIGNGYTYQWQLNGGTIPGATNATYIATASGAYGAVVTNASSCTTTAAPVTVQVVTAVTPVIDVTNGNMLSTGNYAGYQWYRNGVAIPGATNKDYTATRDGSYTVEVTIMTSCTRTSAAVIVNSLSVGGTTLTPVSFYPNPASTMVTIVADKAVNVSLSSVDGKEVLRAADAKTIDIANLADGVYILRITDKDGQLLKTDRLIKAAR